MPLRLPESGYRTMAPARGSTGDGQDRSARRTHQGLTRPARSLTPASGTTRSRPRHCGSSPRPSARSDPARASQPDDHAEPAGPARRAECQDLDGQGPGRPTAGARPERRISHGDCDQRSSRSATSLPERERTERRLGAGEVSAEPGSWRRTDRSLMRPAGGGLASNRDARPLSFPGDQHR
jgi:hypothetical protein